MKSRIPSKSSQLSALQKKFNAWAIERCGARYNPLDDLLQDYPGWEELSIAFIGFLKSKPVPEWTKNQGLMVKNVVTLDWAHHRLLKTVHDEELLDLLVQPYPDDTIRMYMLVRGSRIEPLPIRQRVALQFLENETSEAVRDIAFEILARGKWSSTEEYAKLWWESGDVVKRIVSLKALQAAESNQLGAYLDMAAKSDDKILRSVAESISIIGSVER